MQLSGKSFETTTQPSSMPGSLYNLPQTLRTGPVRSLPLSILLVNTKVKRVCLPYSATHQAALTGAHGSCSGVNTGKSLHHRDGRSNDMAGLAWRKYDDGYAGSLAGSSSYPSEPRALKHRSLWCSRYASSVCQGVNTPDMLGCPT